MSVKIVHSNPETEDFRIPASDTKGHNIRQWFRCMPAMARQVEQVVQSRVFPYRTKGDLFRHALHRHMDWLATQEAIPSVSKQVDIIIEIMRDDEMDGDFALVFEKLEARVTNHLSSGDIGEAAKLISRIKGCIAEMPDGFWKDKYNKKVADKYGDIVKHTPKCRLNAVED